jgi:hypothetical protein
LTSPKLGRARVRFDRVSMPATFFPGDHPHPAPPANREREFPDQFPKKEGLYGADRQKAQGVSPLNNKDEKEPPGGSKKS